jgi:hypothetical protein
VVTVQRYSLTPLKSKIYKRRGSGYVNWLRTDSDDELLWRRWWNYGLGDSKKFVGFEVCMAWSIAYTCLLGYSFVRNFGSVPRLWGNNYIKYNNGMQGYCCDNVIRCHCSETTVTTVYIIATMCSNKCLDSHCCNNVFQQLPRLPELELLFQQWSWSPLLQQMCFNSDTGSFGLPSSYKRGDREIWMGP